MADKINGHDLPKSGLVAVPDSMIVRSLEVRTVHDKIRSLSAPQFTEYLYRTLEATMKANGEVWLFGGDEPDPMWLTDAVLDGLICDLFNREPISRECIVDYLIQQGVTFREE